MKQMATSDGIRAEDWVKVHDLALEIVNADGAEEEVKKSLLFMYLDQLEAQYGPLPSILATRADYLEDEEDRVQLFLRAYSLAGTLHDPVSQLHVAHSLTDLYLQDLQDWSQGEIWLEHLGTHLEQITDSDYREDYARFREMLNAQKDQTAD